jgi:oligosaccharide repeat unit polymerase
MCVGLGLTYLLLPSENTVAIFRSAAIGGSVALGLGIYLETTDVRSVVRTDFLMLAALFGLTLLEFLFPQEEDLLRGFSRTATIVAPEAATKGVAALFLGFCGLIVGRHFTSRHRPTAPIITSLALPQWSSNTLFRVFLVALFLGYLNMLLAVGFNPIELIYQMLRPRFSQPWSRGALGGWPELLGEFSRLILYLVPVIAGAILAKPYRLAVGKKFIVSLGLAFTLFHGFTSGTRNIFVIYFITFIVAYIIVKRDIRWKRLVLLCGGGAVVLLLASYYMLQFRTVGLENYLAGKSHGWREETLFIDNNLVTISMLTEIFPSRHDYLGSEFATVAILNPVPRAIWPGKPEGLSITAESALGVQGFTISSTFVGEAYMMGGYLAVLGVGLLFGMLASWWNRLAIGLGSNVSIILYASGFFAALISMRSMLFTTTAMLPTFAVWLFGKWYQSRREARVAPPASYR